MSDEAASSPATARPLPDPLPRKLNVGCGWDIRAGWLNVDLHSVHNPDLVADVADLPMLPDAAFDEILAQDVIEHLPRAKVPMALREWARLLAPGGVLRLRVPSLTHTAAMLLLPEWRSLPAAEQIFQMVYGTQAYPGDFHQSGFTFRTIAARLADAGLQLCEASLRDGWLIDASARRADALTAPDEIVHNRYVAILGRPADPEGLATFTARIQAGTLDTAGLDAVLAASSEACGVAPSPNPVDGVGGRQLLAELARRVRRRLIGS